MGFPEDVLTADETVVAHLRPHAKVSVRPVLVLVAAVAVVTAAAVLLPGDSGGRTGLLLVAAVALGFALVRGGWPLLVWRCTHYVLTDERILLQDGVLARERRDLPLARVNDHAMSQGLLDRLLGCGTLTVDSVGERAPAVLVAVPRVQQVQQVQTTLYGLIEADRQRQAEGGEDEHPAAPPAPPQPDRRNRAPR